jgi:ribosomal protein S18 acetylase RimI-like enzyme
MDGHVKTASDSKQSPVLLRPEQPDDEAFLLELYASTRQEELDMTQWDTATRQAFVNMQFRAMRQGYASMFPLGQFSIVLLQEQAIGRIVIHRDEHTIRLVDMALVPKARCRGIGTFLVQTLQAEARQSRKPIQLHVLKGNRAAGLYERLGFHRTNDNGVYDEMTWLATA